MLTADKMEHKTVLATKFHCQLKTKLSAAVTEIKRIKKQA
jgi:hypothetical protein